MPGDGAGRVRDEEPGEITFRSTSVKVKPKDWKLVRKGGIIPDDLVQSKQKSFYSKFPNLEIGVKCNNDGSTPSSGVGEDCVHNGVPNVK